MGVLVSKSASSLSRLSVDPVVPSILCTTAAHGLSSKYFQMDPATPRITLPCNSTASYSKIASAAKVLVSSKHFKSTTFDHKKFTYLISVKKFSSSQLWTHETTSYQISLCDQYSSMYVGSSTM